MNKTLSHQVADLEHENKVLEDQNRENQIELKRKGAKIQELHDKLSARTQGNAIFIRHDGFSRVMYIEPFRGLHFMMPDESERLPAYSKFFEQDYRCVPAAKTLTFERTSKKDEFDRTIYREI